jgi:hypothetical protein
MLPTFKEAIKRQPLQRNECWINSLYDFYGDKLLNPEKKRCLITRASILETIGKTEENIQNGISHRDILPFF